MRKDDNATNLAILNGLNDHELDLYLLAIDSMSNQIKAQYVTSSAVMRVELGDYGANVLRALITIHENTGWTVRIIESRLNEHVLEVTKTKFKYDGNPADLANANLEIKEALGS